MRPPSDDLLLLAWSEVWQLTVLIVAVAAASRLVARRRPHLAYALWLLVLLKCLTPPVWSSPTGIFSWIETRLAEESPASAPTAESTAVASSTAEPSREPATVTTEALLPHLATAAVSQVRHGRETVPRRDVAQQSETGPQPMTPNTPREAKASRGTALQSRPGRVGRPVPLRSYLAGAVRDFGKGAWPAVLVAVWAAGAILLGGVGLGRAIAFGRRQRRSALAADPQLVLAVNSLARRVGVWRKVRLAIASEQIGPMAYGALRPTLLLPLAALQGKTAGQLEPILAHELVHIRRGDTVVGLLQFLAQSLWWFHPLVWWANRRTCWERERCCDEEVVARLGCRPADYARSLVDVIELRQELRPVSFFATMGRGQIVAQRLEEIMNRVGKSHRRTPVWCWAVVASVAVVVLPGARPSVSAPVGKGESGTVSVASAGTVARSGDRPTTEIAAAPAADKRTTASAKNSKDGSQPLTVTQPARIEAFETTNVYSQARGFVAKVFADVGDRVKKGQLLAKLSSPDLEAEVRMKAAIVQQAKAEVEGAAAAVPAAEAAVATAQARITESQAGVVRYEAEVARWQAQLARLEKMAAEHTVDEQARDETRDQLKAAEAGRAEARAKLESSKAAIAEGQAGLTKAKANLAAACARVHVATTDLTRQKILLDKTQICAPYDGLVARRNVNTGDYVTAFTGTGVPLLVVMRADILRVLVPIPEAYALRVGVGAKAVVRVPAVPAVFQGTVTRTAGVLDRKTNSMQAEIDLSNTQGKLWPGMYAEATVTVEHPR